MAKNDSRNLNVTIRSQDDRSSDVVLSMSTIFHMLGKYFLPWIIISVMAAVLLLGVSTVSTLHRKPPLTALVSFTYDGIEKGLDPAGRTFDVNTLKNTTVLESTLTELGKDLDSIEDIRENITIEGIIPSDAIDKLTTYKSVMDTAVNGSLSAAQAVLDVSWYPTQFKVRFDYAGAGFGKNDGVQILNTMLDNYRDYFYTQYGYNANLGVAVSAVNYSDYDYTEAVDLFKTSLTTLEKYVKELADHETVRYRSVATGRTFNDLYQAVKAVETIDLDVLSSKIFVNNLTKDKQESINYYTYRMEDLEREQKSLTEVLDSIEASIKSYQKDTIVVMQGTDGNSATLSQSSEEYDKLLERKLNVATDLAEAKRSYAYYEARKKALESSKNVTDEQKESLEKEFEALNTKLTDLVDVINATAEEYYETVEYANAYNVLVPAVNSASNTISDIVKHAFFMILVVEALIFVIYIAVSFIKAVKCDYKKKPALFTGDPDDDDDDDEDEELAEVIEEIASEEEKNSSKPAGNADSKKNKNRRK